MKKEQKERIQIIIFIIFFSLLYFPTSLSNNNSLMTTLNIISILLFCIAVSLFSFDVVLSLKNITKYHYLGVHIIYTSYPFGLFSQYERLDEKWLICISLIISIIMVILLYRKLKHINIERLRLEHLKFYNLLITVIFSTLFPLLNLLFDKDLEAKLFLICIAPLLFLNVIYEKRLLQDGK